MSLATAATALLSIIVFLTQLLGAQIPRGESKETFIDGSFALYAPDIGIINAAINKKSVKIPVALLIPVSVKGKMPANAGLCFPRCNHQVAELASGFAGERSPAINIKSMINNGFEFIIGGQRRVWLRGVHALYPINNGFSGGYKRWGIAKITELQFDVQKPSIGPASFGFYVAARDQFDPKPRAVIAKRLLGNIDADPCCVGDLLSNIPRPFGLGDGGQQSPMLILTVFGESFCFNPQESSGNSQDDGGEERADRTESRSCVRYFSPFWPVILVWAVGLNFGAVLVGLGTYLCWRRRMITGFGLGAIGTFLGMFAVLGPIVGWIGSWR